MLWVFLFFLFNSYALNYEPDWLPPARKAVPLSISLDGLQYGVEFQVGPQKLLLILDTSLPDIIIFNQSLCDTCYDPSYPPTSFEGVLYRTTDGETTMIEHYFHTCKQMNFSINLIGVSAHEKLFTELGYLFGNKVIVYGGAGLAPIHQSGWADGILGASYESIFFPHSSCISTFWNLVTNSYQGETLTPILSLDLFDASQTSMLYLGGIHEPYRESLMWSTPSTLDYTFQIYDLSLCGTILNANSLNMSDGMQGIVDTGASCLTLPAELFDLVAEHLPISCGYANENEAQFSVAECEKKIGTQMFYLPDDATTQLPTLSFRLSPQGPWLYLSLTTLILPRQSVNNYWPDNNRKPLCLYRGNSGGKIVFGSLALRSFFVSVSMEPFQVGFANKLSTSESTVQCIKRIPCDGMQLHNKAVNICEDPQCHLYYFFVFDTATKTCQLSLSFHVAAIFVILTFLIIELGMNEAHKWLSTKVMSNFEETI